MAGSWEVIWDSPTEAGLGPLRASQMQSLRGLQAPSRVSPVWGCRLRSPPWPSSHTCQSAQPCLMVEMKF